MPQINQKKIKVLFLAYPRIGLNLGGLEIQIQKTIDALQNLGVEVILYNPWKNQLPDVDVCHIFSLDGALFYHAQRAYEMKIPIVISSVFNNFNGPVWFNRIKVLLGQNAPGMYTELNRAGKMLSLADKVIALNAQEKNLLIKAFKLAPGKINILPNGIETKFKDCNPDLFIEKFGFDDFVLQVASIEKRKNQLNLIKAINKTPYKLVLIGRANASNQHYLDECQSVANENVLFIGQLEHSDPLLASAFSAAKLFVLPSYSEVMPLSIYEAAIANCKLAVSKNVPVSPEIEKYIKTFSPDNHVEMAKIITDEMNSPVTGDIRAIVTKMPSWEDIGREIKNIYLETIKSRECNSMNC